MPARRRQAGRTSQWSMSRAYPSRALRPQKLTVEERLKLFVQVCEAIQHAHQKASFTRTSKPSNIQVGIEPAGNPEVLTSEWQALSQP